MGWHERLWVGIYKGVEVQEVKKWTKMQRVLCVCVKDEKSWNIELKDTKNIYFLIRKVLKYWTKDTKNIYFLNRKVLKHWTKWNKKSIFNFFSYLWCGIWEYFILFFWYRVLHLTKSHSFPHKVSTYIYIYIYIYIYLIYWPPYIK